MKHEQQTSRTEKNSTLFGGNNFSGLNLYFILIVPTVKNITTEIQQFMANNNSVLLSMADELTLQPDGSFKPKRSISACMKLSEQGCSQVEQTPTLPIAVYKYLVYSDL